MWDVRIIIFEYSHNQTYFVFDYLPLIYCCVIYYAPARMKHKIMWFYRQMHRANEKRWDAWDVVCGMAWKGKTLQNSTMDGGRKSYVPIWLNRRNISIHLFTVWSNRYSSGCNTSPQDKRVSNDKDTQVAVVTAQLLLTYCIKRIYFQKIISQHSVVARRQRRNAVSQKSWINRSELAWKLWNRGLGNGLKERW